MKTDQTTSQIAQRHLGIATLEVRNVDSLDFHEVAVWQIREALQAAYAAGLAAQKAAPL